MRHEKYTFDFSIVIRLDNIIYIMVEREKLINLLENKSSRNVKSKLNNAEIHVCTDCIILAN